MGYSGSTYTDFHKNMKKKQQKQVKNVIIYGFLFLAFAFFLVAAAYSLNLLNQSSTDNRTQAQSKNSGLITVAVPINPGQNFISLPVSTTINIQQLCNRYPIVSVSEKISDDAGSWKEYECNNLQQNGRMFLQERVGYMLKAETAFSIEFKGSEIEDYAYSHVKPGWSSVGIPMAEEYSLTAHNLCGPLSGTTVEIVEVSAWQDGAWSSHICSVPQMNAFSLSNWKGYLVRSEQM